MIKREKFQYPFKTIKPLILERDGNKCVKCSLTLSLEVHHIEGYKHNNPESLATLCYFCHGIAPMGKEAFAEWLEHGQSGLKILQQRLAARGLRLDREQIIEFCSVLIELDLDFRVSKFRIARERIRNSGVRCDGRKPYGTFDGEAEILARMTEMRVNGALSREIAEALNSAGTLSRYGKPWRASTIAKIFKRKTRYEQ